VCGWPAVYAVAGEGPLRDELRRRAESLGVPVRLTGFLEHADLLGALSAADVYLHPSLEEIFPNSVGEAMSCARPVVATDVGGTAELLGDDGRAGILVPAGEVEAIALQLERLLSDSDLRRCLADEARRRVELEFPLSRMVERYRAVVTEAVGG
jgi:glycosyltransferase involved in cell wall biosynthesis